MSSSLACSLRDLDPDGREIHAEVYNKRRRGDIAGTTFESIVLSIVPWGEMSGLEVILGIAWLCRWDGGGR